MRHKPWLAVGGVLTLLAHGVARAQIPYTIQPIVKLGDVAGGVLIPAGVELVPGPLTDTGRLLIDAGTVNGSKPDFLAGVPQNKQQAGPGTDGFTFAAYQNVNSGIANSYGTPLTNYLGSLVFDPSAAHPDFEFSIKNFSQLPGYDPINGFGLVAYAGSPDDTYAEEGVLFPRVAFGRIPEPATVFGWSLMMFVGAAWHARARGRSRRTQA